MTAQLEAARKKQKELLEKRMNIQGIPVGGPTVHTTAATQTNKMTSFDGTVLGGRRALLCLPWFCRFAVELVDRHGSDVGGSPAI